MDAAPVHSAGLSPDGIAELRRAALRDERYETERRLRSAAGRAALTAVLEDLARSQHGVISHDQAIRLGLSAAAIQRRVRSGRWRRVWRGVYATSPKSLNAAERVATIGDVWAALLYAGDDAVASHETAAWLDGYAEPPPVIDVIVPRSRQVAGRADVRFHRGVSVAARRHPSKLPARTRVEDTVLDLCDRATHLDDVVAVVTRVCRDRLTTTDRLRAAAAGRAKLRWRTELAGLLDDVAAGVHSLLERRYLERVERAHGLPRGARQHAIRRGRRQEYKDVYYEDPYDVVVELDGPVGHSRDEDRLRDMRRDNADTVAGRIVLRYGPRDVERQPCLVAEQVGAALRLRGWNGGIRPCGPRCPVQP